MKRHVPTAICASLILLCSNWTSAQVLPAANADGFATGIRRLPISEPTAPVYVAHAHLGRPLKPAPTLIGDTCDRCYKDRCECERRWGASGDVLWMSRSRVNPQTMIESELGALVVTESFNARELLFDVRAGFRASVGYDLQDGQALEIATYSVFDQPATADVSDTNMFFTFHSLSPTVASNAYTINYDSSLHNGELNWWLAETWGIRPMVGLRWIRVAEEFSILDTTGTSWDAFSKMTNDLIGPQLGLKMRLWDVCNWVRIEAAMKSGLFHNEVDYQASVVDELGASQGSIRRTPSATSVAGEITIAAVVQFCPSLALRFGYHGLWMSEIGMAPNQADQSDITTGIGTDHLGGLNYQGGFLGLEANW